MITLAQAKMTLRGPTDKILSVGMRKLAEGPVVTQALATLMGRARVSRTVWSRRVQQYEAKINSGDIVTVEEVVRDLYRPPVLQAEQTYSDRQFYEAALDRLAREIAAVNQSTQTEAVKIIEAALGQGARSGVLGKRSRRGGCRIIAASKGR